MDEALRRNRRGLHDKYGKDEGMVQNGRFVSQWGPWCVSEEPAATAPTRPSDPNASSLVAQL